MMKNKSVVRKNVMETMEVKNMVKLHTHTHTHTHTSVYGKNEESIKVKNCKNCK